MTFLCLTAWGLMMTFLARRLSNRWFNHLTLYTLLWTVMLLSYELRLIAYNSIVLEAWLYVFVAWISLYLGTLLGSLLFPTVPKQKFPEINLVRLRHIIIGLTVGGLISTFALAENLLVALKTGGILTALTQYSAQIYTMRFEGEVTGVMYLNFLPYAGCALAGIYAARLGRITLAAALPLFAMVADGIVSMQRTGMVVGALLFAFSYAFTPKVQKLRLARWQKIVVGCAVLASFLAVTLERGAGEYFEAQTGTLYRISEVISVAPVVYLYISGPLPCFSEYLKNPSDDGKPLWGRYMLASVYRFLAKFGYDTYVPYYPAFYSTPVPVNAGTYLRELHRDFGGAAIFFFPFSLGFFIAFLDGSSRTPFTVILLSFLYLVVAFSIDFNFIGGGGWYFPLPIALIVALLIKPHAAPRASLARAPAVAL